MKESNDEEISIQELQYYFDGQARDSLDSGKVNRKCSQVLTLRNKLMQLPDEEFNVAIRTLENMVGDPSGESSDSRAENDLMARQLYSKTN